MTNELSTVAQVDVARYLGRWFEIARKPMRHEDAGARDITAEYTRNDDGSIRVLNTCINEEQKVEQAEGRARPVDDSNARLEVSFLPEALQWVPFTKGDYWIIKLDPDYQTALVGEPSRKYLWLLHRQPHLDRALAGQWLAVAAAQGYDLSDLIWPAQSGAAHGATPPGG